MNIVQHLSDPFYECLALIGLFIILFGLISLFIKERLYLTESLVAIIIGTIFGPKCAGILSPKDWVPEDIFYRGLMEFSRVIISFQVMAVGLSLPGVYVKKHWRDILMFLGPIMCLMWAVSSFAVYLFSGLDIWTCLMIGACLAPTDPVLANAVIRGKFANRYIPSHLRNLLSVESGANDGLGFPFLMLPIYLKLWPVGKALQHWFLHTWLYEISLSIVIGVVVGFAAKFLLEQSEKRKLIDNDSFLVYSMAIAMSITGLVALISSDDLLAVFIAGNVFAYDDKYQQATKDSHFQEVIDMLFNCIFFIFLGAIFPWSSFVELGIGRLLLIAGTILIFRRLPFVMVLRPLIPQLKTHREAFFAGWFGPMGVGAIFFAMVCRHHDGISEEVASSVFTVVTFVVLSSIVIHGITVPITHVHLKTRARRKAQRELRRTSKLHAFADGSQQPPGLRDIPSALEAGLASHGGSVVNPIKDGDGLHARGNYTEKDDPKMVDDYDLYASSEFLDEQTADARHHENTRSTNDNNFSDFSDENAASNNDLSSGYNTSVTVTTSAGEETLDGRAMRKEQILARLMQATASKSLNQHPQKEAANSSGASAFP